MNKHIKTNEPNLKQLFKIILQYKWSILLTMLIISSIAFINTYFKPSVYVSNSIIKVKGNEKKQSEDVINNTLSTSKSKDVLEEISLLKTFKINNKALDTVNFKILYFQKNAYKQDEIYDKDVPINISNLTILDKSILGKRITITPKDDTYSLDYEPPYTSKLKAKLFNTKEFHFNTIKNQPFGKKVSNEYFEFQVDKKNKVKQAISFIINGEKRDIFQSLIYPRLKISQLEKDTSLINISFEDTIPQRANLYVNALTKSFIEYSVESKNNQNNETLKFINKELKNIKKQLKNSEDRLEEHQVTTNIVKPSVQASLYIQNLSKLEIEISENNLKHKLVTNLINFVKSNYNLDAIAPSVSKLQDQNTLALISKLQNNQILEEELMQEYTDEYPKLKTLRKQNEAIRKKIEYNLNSLRSNINYKNLNLIKRKKSYENSMKTLPSKERQLVNIKRNYEVKSKMYEYLLKKQAENKIIQLATFSNYQVIDFAYNTNIPIKPKRLLILVLSLFLGLVLGIVIALFRHAKNNYIKDKNELEQITTLPIYGNIPYQKQTKNIITVHKKVKSPFSEAFRSLRTNLQFMSKQNNSTVILITSTVAGEGKSTCVANLGTILEMAKYKTIIINFDLRKPTLHKFFDLDNSKGISSFLAGNHSVDEIISPTEFANLDIIPSGPIPSDPSELILSKKLPTLFEQLKNKYEYIIVDTAPIGIISDTKTLMPLADLNLVIVRED